MSLTTPRFLGLVSSLLSFMGHVALQKRIGIIYEFQEIPRKENRNNDHTTLTRGVPVCSLDWNVIRVPYACTAICARYVPKHLLQCYHRAPSSRLSENYGAREVPLVEVTAGASADKRLDFNGFYGVLVCVCSRYKYCMYLQRFAWGALAAWKSSLLLFVYVWIHMHI